MKKASEILKGLRDCEIGEEEAQRIVKGKISAGEALDDLTVAGLDVDGLDRAVYAMKASLSGDYFPDDEPEDIIKSSLFDDLDGIDEDTDIFEALEGLKSADNRVAKALNGVNRSTAANHEVVVKGLLAVARTNRDQAQVIKAMSETINGLESQIGGIAKALQVPEAPTAILTGAQPAPAPFEDGVAKGGMHTTTKAFNALDLMKAARSEFDEIKKAGITPDNRLRAQTLGRVITKCESGGIQNVTEYAKANSISLA